MRASMLGRLGVVALLVVGGCVREGAQHKAAGNILFRNGDLEGALREYRAAVAEAPADANGHTLLGNALFEKGDLDGAAREYRDALARDPSARAARRGLATVALKSGDVAGARSGFEALVESAPHDPEAQSALAKLLLAQGDLDGAERHLREAQALVHNDPAVLYLLGVTLARKGQPAEALSALASLEAAAPAQAYAPYGRAVVAALGHKPDEAFEWLGRAVERGIADVDAVAADPALASLRSDPRFGALLARAHVEAKKGAR